MKRVVQWISGSVLRSVGKETGKEDHETSTAERRELKLGSRRSAHFNSMTSILGWPETKSFLSTEAGTMRKPAAARKEKVVGHC